jgi:SAM-dependent methyltransferase
MDDRDDELAAIYDVIYGEQEDVEFWLGMAAAARDGPVLELGCGTGRILLPLARAGFDVMGLDRASHMLRRCRAKLGCEPPEVRRRVQLVEADMTSFDVARRFALVTIPFAGFQHLRTVDEQLACLDRCRTHLRPYGRLVLDMPNPAPAPPSHAAWEESAQGEAAAQTVAWTAGRHVRWWGTVIAYDQVLQCNEYELTYEIIGADGAARRITERFPLRYIFRYELEHLLVRAGFRVVTLYGDHNGSPFGEGSPALIAVAALPAEHGSPSRANGE